MTRVGVDVGGTFTDCIIAEPTGEIRIHKRPSTPDDPARAFLLALAEADVDVCTLEKTVHGTTVAVNTLIELKGARTGLITTRGFRDVLEIGRSTKPPSDYFNLHWQKPAPLVPRELRREVTGRISAEGVELIPLDETEVAEELQHLVDAGCEAIAVCLLFSYVSPVHEQRIRELAQRDFPGVQVSLSSEIFPQWKEYERTCTTVADAYVKPRMSRYFGRLQDELKSGGADRELLIMKSNGGLMTASSARRVPIHTALSGPAAGALAGQFIGRSAGYDRVITMDMGGTSYDVSLVQNGDLSYTTETTIEGRFPVLIPTIDIRTIGAGGGSIAWIDSGGGFKVGPRSAGAVPGPACYGGGGAEPTVTDANLLLGRLGARTALAGGLRLDESASQASFRHVAQVLGLDVVDVADGAIEVCVATMAHETRTISAEKGFDPREFVLIAAGGAGPLHAALIAEALGMFKVLVPPNPGLLSASGLLLADPKFDIVRSWPFLLERHDPGRLGEAFGEMIDEAFAIIAAEGIVEEPVVLQSVDMRYQGQNWELTVPVSNGDLATETLVAAFDREHARLYGVSVPGAKHEVVNLRVSALAPQSSPERWLPRGTQDLPGDPLLEERNVHDPRRGSHGTPVLDRRHLGVDQRIAGPCVIEQTDTTIFIPSDWLAVPDARGNILLERSPSGDDSFFKSIAQEAASS